MELVRCTGVYDDQGNFAPTYDKTIIETVEADVIMMAVGYATDLHFISPEASLQTENGLITVNPDTEATSVPGIFAAGAVAHGPATVIEALATGKKAATAINEYLGGASVKSEDEQANNPFLKFNNEYLKETSRVKAPKLPVDQRRIDIEDTPGIGLSEAEAEANRCFNCGCVSVNSSDICIALVALDAEVEAAGVGGVRIIPIREFFGSVRNNLEVDEIITGIKIPRLPTGARQTFLKFRPREAIDFAVVSVAAVLTYDGNVCQDARLVLGAVAPVPVRATEAERMLKGKVIDEALAEQAATAAISGAKPLSKNGYKVAIARELVKRVILAVKAGE
jgi:CO/xanthine dehydrogenase FAD-binding subunit